LHVGEDQSDRLRGWYDWGNTMTKLRPNIVFILCDNVGWGVFSCYGGNTPIPRIDKLAGEGTQRREREREAAEHRLLPMGQPRVG
jgi:hypothetical protein